MPHYAIDREVVYGRRAEKGHVGRSHRTVPFCRHDHQGIVWAEQGFGIKPLQVDGPLQGGRARQVSPQIERNVQLDKGHRRRHRRRQGHRAGRRRGARRTRMRWRRDGFGPSHTRAGGPRGVGHTGRLGRIRHSRGDEGGELLPQLERRQLLWLLEGLPAELPQAISPVAAGSVI